MSLRVDALSLFPEALTDPSSAGDVSEVFALILLRAALSEQVVRVDCWVSSLVPLCWWIVPASIRLD